ncbi:MAG: hypothetical protein Q9225_006816 [Loekoesia sp. 1 TL-2023]
MISLTVGQVSGVIAAVVLGDSATSQNVSRRVTLLTWLGTFSLIILGVTGVVTPLGLSDSIRPDGAVRTEFRYVKDQSAFGYGTPSRYPRFARLCGDLVPVNCPGRSDGYKNPEVLSNGTIIVEATVDDSYFNTSIPENITEVFSSATDGTTLSGPFDIQYRTWDINFDKAQQVIDRGQSYASGSYRSLESLVLHNRVEALEGIIVDSMNGGIGYRNHTAPLDLPYGGEWSEEITWIEPVTECADTNLTFEIHTGGYADNITDVYLVDNGGFVNHPREIDFDIEPSQDLDLQERALKGALFSNALLMFHFNVTYPNNTGPRNTSIGRRFQLNTTSTFYRPPLYSIQLTQLQPSFVELDYFSIDSFNSSSSNTNNFTGNTMDDWQQVQYYCQGGTDIRQTNISNVALMCGYLYGAPTPSYRDDPRIFQPYSVWNQSLYVCSSSVRASVKMVSFSSNGTESLENLRVRDVKDKEYADPSSAPLWAVERTYRSIFETSALWGPVAEKYIASPGLTTHRASKFFLPAISSQAVVSSSDSLAASDVFVGALMSVYEEAMKPAISASSLADYSGLSNLALNLKWQTLSQAATTASQIINLIYTEVLATATVGTKSADRSTDIPPSAVRRAGPRVPARVTVYRKQLRYNYLYGIPAALILFITFGITVVLLACLVSRFKYRDFVQLLNQTSTGRVVTNLISPELSQPDAKTKIWVRTAGGTKLRYPFYIAYGEDPSVAPVEVSSSKTEGMQTDGTSQVAISNASIQENGNHPAQHETALLQECDSENRYDSSHHSPLLSSPGVSPIENEAPTKEAMQVQVRQL